MKYAVIGEPSERWSTNSFDTFEWLIKFSSNETSQRFLWYRILNGSPAWTCEKDHFEIWQKTQQNIYKDINSLRQYMRECLSISRSRDVVKTADRGHVTFNTDRKRQRKVSCSFLEDIQRKIAIDYCQVEGRSRDGWKSLNYGDYVLLLGIIRFL